MGDNIGGSYIQGGNILPSSSSLTVNANRKYVEEGGSKSSRSREERVIEDILLKVIQQALIDVDEGSNIPYIDHYQMGRYIARRLVSSPKLDIQPVIEGGTNGNT